MGAIAPREIAKDGLFQLDVDDAIWQDVGLQDEPGGVPPAWLCDENVRLGIQYILQYDRCVEEERRLIKEKRALCDWLREEWLVNRAAFDSSGLSFFLY